MRAGQGLQLLVPLADGLAAHPAVELQLLHALQQLDHLLPELLALPPAAEHALAQAAHLQSAQLQRGVGRGG